MRRLKKTPSVLLGIISGALITWGLSNFYKNSTPQQYNQSTFTYTVDLLQKKYVDVVNIDSLLNLVVPELLNKLDPHSEFIPKENLTTINESIEGKFDGIGVVFNMATDTAMVLSVVVGGPGAKAGVEPGDRIIKVNDTIVAGVKLDQFELVKKLRGVRGTQVKLGIQRGNSKEIVDFTLTRAEIRINSIEAQFLRKDSTGYLRINTFAANTYMDAVNAMDKLISQGAKSIIIDLRGNGGGLLDQALMLADEFLQKGQGIVYVEGAHFPRREQLASGMGAFKDVELYVLIDESSASASEIFAGAMQDNERAVILGRRSFGKGLVQEQVPFKDGSAARLTVARYYTPLGRPLQKPYTSGDSKSYEEEVLERYLNKEVSTGVNAHVDSSVTYTTKSGKVLFGGGGITPDIFVGIDTTELPRYFVELFNKNAIFLYAQQYTERYRSQINKISDVSQLDEFFAGHSDLYDGFINYAATSKGVKRPNATDRSEARELVETQLRAYVARNTPLGESGFYYYIQDIDDVFRRFEGLGL